MSLQQSRQQPAQQPTQQSAKLSAQEPATTSMSASSGFMRDPLPHLTTSLLCSAFPKMPAILDIDLSAFLMTTTSTTDYPPMPIVEDINFQPYIAQAWVAFQVDRVSKDKSRSASISMVLRLHLIRPPWTKLLIWSHAELLYQKRWRFYLQSSSEQLRLLWLQCQ